MWAYVRNRLKSGSENRDPPLGQDGSAAAKSELKLASLLYPKISALPMSARRGIQLPKSLREEIDAKEQGP